MLPQEYVSGPELPALGTILPIALYKLDRLEQYDLPAPGAWVKLRNVCVVMLRGQLLVRTPHLQVTCVPLPCASWTALSSMTCTKCAWSCCTASCWCARCISRLYVFHVPLDCTSWIALSDMTYQCQLSG